MLIWLQQRWPSQVTQPRPCFFNGCSVLCMYLVFLTERKPMVIINNANVLRVKKKKKKTNIKTPQEIKREQRRLKFYLQERWWRSVVPKHQSSEAPYFVSWSQESQLFFTGRRIFNRKHYKTRSRGFGARAHRVAERPLNTQLCGRYHFFFEAPGLTGSGSSELHLVMQTSHLLYERGCCSRLMPCGLLCETSSAVIWSSVGRWGLRGWLSGGGKKRWGGRDLKEQMRAGVSLHMFVHTVCFCRLLQSTNSRRQADKMASW